MIFRFLIVLGIGMYLGKFFGGEIEQPEDVGIVLYSEPQPWYLDTVERICEAWNRSLQYWFENCSA